MRYGCMAMPHVALFQVQLFAQYMLPHVTHTAAMSGMVCAGQSRVFYWCRCAEPCAVNTDTVQPASARVEYRPPHHKGSSNKLQTLTEGDDGLWLDQQRACKKLGCVNIKVHSCTLPSHVLRTAAGAQPSTCAAATTRTIILQATRGEIEARGGWWVCTVCARTRTC